MKRLLSWFWHLFSFQNSKMKRSYYLFNKEMEITLLSLVQALATITLIILSIVGFCTNVGLKETLIRVSLIIASLICFLIRRRWSEIYKVMITLVAGGFAFHMVFYSLQVPGKLNSYFFINGNAVGMFEIMFVLSFKTLWFRSAAYGMLIIIKIACLYENLSNQPRTYLQFLFCVVQVLIFCLYHDIIDRRNFGLIYQATEKTKKFQDLLSNDLPSSVMIMCSNFSSILYSNNFFKQQFVPDGSEESAAKIINNLFGKLMLEEEKNDMFERSQQKHQTSILDYLVRITTENLDTQVQDQVRTLYASYKNEESNQYYYEVRLGKILWDNKHSYAIVMNDITDKQLVSALKIADSHKDRVIATVSHELRTPINGILGLLEMASELAIDKNLLKYIENCKSCSKLLLYLVNAILDLSQIRNNRLHIVKSTFNLPEMLEELRSLYIFQSNQKGIEFIIEKNSDIDEEVYTDKYRLIEVLINLLGNSVKFTFKGYVKLKISKSEERKETLIFSVEDTGLGIKEEDKTKLFRMFGKLEQENQNINTHGVGLGLTIANELVKALSIRHKKEGIMFESQFNKGSKFWFELDTSKSLESSSRAVDKNLRMNTDPENFDSQDFSEFLDLNGGARQKFERVGVQDRLHSETNPFLGLSKEGEDFSLTSPMSLECCARPQVLLVDDNPLNLMAASFILGKLKLSVTKAFNGVEGIRLLEESAEKKQKYCLILTDIQMPIMDGLEMSKVIKDKIEKKEIYPVPIVALTAKKLDQQELKKYEECGIVCSLEKPLVKNEIEKIISKLLK